MQLLYSQIIGEGTPLIILHGFLGMADNWRGLGTRLSEQGFQVHLLDQRNHGRSFHSPGFSYPLLCDDLLYYMQYHHIETAALLGHSMGGKTAMLFACQHPERVSKLVVADIAPKGYPVHHHLIIKALQQVDFSQITTRAQVQEILAHHLQGQDLLGFLLKNVYWHTPERLGFRFNLPALAFNLPEIGKQLPQGMCFSGETLFLKGGDSTYIEKEDEKGILQAFPQAQLHTIEGAGHWLHAQKPEEFLHKVLSFLKNQ